MPVRAPRICSCGEVIASGEACPCQIRRAAERKARHDQRRPNSSQRGYNRDWEKARAAFLRSRPFCAFCGAPASVVDHITPHKGDQLLFWDRNNWSPLCTPCHSGAKQRQERRVKKETSS